MLEAELERDPAEDEREQAGLYHGSDDRDRACCHV